MHSVKGTESAQPMAAEESVLGQIQESARRLGIPSERVVRALQTAAQGKSVIDVDALKVLAEVGAVRIIKSEELTRLGESLAADSDRIAAAPEVQRKITDLQEKLAFAEADVEAAVALTESAMTRFFGYRFHDRWDLLTQADKRHAEIEAELNAQTRELQEVSELKNGIPARTQELSEFVVSGEWSYAVTPKGVRAADGSGIVTPIQEDLAQVAFNVRRFDDVVATAREVPVFKPRTPVDSMPHRFEGSEDSAPKSTGTHNQNGKVTPSTDPADEALRVVASQRDAQSVNQLIEVVAPQFSSTKIVELLKVLWDGGMIPAGEMAEVVTTHAKKLGSAIAPLVAQITEKLIEDESNVGRASVFLSEHASSFRRFEVPTKTLNTVAVALGNENQPDKIGELLSSFAHLLSSENLKKLLDGVRRSNLSAEGFYHLVAERQNELGVHFGAIIEDILEGHLDEDSAEEAKAVVLAHPSVIARRPQFPALVLRLVKDLGDTEELVPVSELLSALAPYISRANLVKLLNAALESDLSSDDSAVLVSEYKDRLGADFRPIARTLAQNCIDADDFEGALCIVKDHISSLKNDPKFGAISTSLAKHFGEEGEKEELGELINVVTHQICRKKTIDLLIAALDAGLHRDQARELVDSLRETLGVDLIPFVAKIVRGHLNEGGEIENAEQLVIGHGALIPLEAMGKFVVMIGAARKNEDETDEFKNFLVSLADMVSNQKLIYALEAVKNRNCFDRGTFAGLVAALSEKLGEQTIRRLSK